MARPNGRSWDWLTASEDLVLLAVAGGAIYPAQVCEAIERITGSRCMNRKTIYNALHRLAASGLIDLREIRWGSMRFEFEITAAGRAMITRMAEARELLRSGVGIGPRVAASSAAPTAATGSGDGLTC